MNLPFRFAAFSVFFLVFGSLALAQSLYSVAIDTARLHGTEGRLIFEITSNSPLTNRVDVLNFATDGQTDLPETRGEGLVTGDLIQALNPARRTRMKANGFLTELTIPFASFGDRIEFLLNLSETAARANRPPDQFSLYLLGADDSPLSMMRGRRPRPAFSISITGDRGGKLDIKPAVTRREASSDEAEVESDQGDDDAVVVSLRRPNLEPGGGRGRAASISVLPAWAPDDPTEFVDALVFEGDLAEYCNRRCAGEVICTGGAFALTVGDDRYPLDEIGNLKAQVAIVDQGKDPRLEGPLGRAKVRGVLSGPVLVVQSIEIN